MMKESFEAATMVLFELEVSDIITDSNAFREDEDLI